jgi:DNA-directed RNA polymerase specialized sigma subunit
MAKPSNRGTAGGLARAEKMRKLSERDYELIHRMREQKISQAKIAAVVGCSQVHVSRILHGRTSG